ncbi:ricin-type beta-trefoil lectin domain protein [Trichormus sp. NMC-1]|uniref:ricin-type beta-trefoil lectin domain protein n=1 Tax=Trichormus sp. NMC-1 TaxID=1853259 RepID=UPI0008DC0038|nr:ricin-type beta-trefoil lectin domain protein [Trichormus sp. NMC-1]
MNKLNLSVLVLGTAIGITIGSSAALAENFIVDGNKALNTNNNFRRVDGNPVMSIWDFSSTDRDQQFDRISGNRGGTLLRHNSTGKCLNSHYLTNGGVVNTWPCDPSDPDQNFNIISLGNGFSQIQRTGTNLCVDSPTRNNGGTVHVWQCDPNNPNQRFKNGSTPPPPPPQGQVILPFNRGETWYVCQGYRGSVSHQNSFALDLSVGQDFGSNNACWGQQNRSANRQVLAPAAGKIYYINSDLVCLSIDSNRSMLIGHINRSVQNGATVNRGQVLGTTSSQRAANGYFSHIHLEGRRSSRCTPGSSVPLTAANGFQLENVGDLVGKLTHFKRALTRP